MRVLVAEDDSASRVGLEVILAEWGYEVSSAENGRRALEIVTKEGVDIAILDWLMPGIDGLQLCRKIREQQEQGYIYVIMLTGKVRNEDVVTGLDSGADDYIVKPFEPEILRSRLAAGARICRYERLLVGKNAELKSYSEQMEQLAKERSKQLVHAERMATVGLLSAGIAHEINNPTSFISGNVQTLEHFMGDIEPYLREVAEVKGDKKLEYVLLETPKLIEGMKEGVRRISRIVNGLKVFCRKGREQSERCEIDDCVTRALELCHNRFKYHMRVERSLPGSLPPVWVNSQQLEQVLVNLFVNAADATREQGKGYLFINAALVGDDVEVVVEDDGPGVPEDKLDDIWQPFYTTKKPDEGTGLGLFTCQGIIEGYGGRISCENRSEGGARFRIRLPIEGGRSHG